MAILSAVILPFGGVSATSVVDYEKSIGQVDGADTVNWVVEATDDGGYVVGGQTIMCYKDMLPEPVLQMKGDMKAFSYADEEGVEVAPFSECLKYYQDHGYIETWNYHPGMVPVLGANTNDDDKRGVSTSGDEFMMNVSKTLIAKVCGFGDGGLVTNWANDDDDGDETYSYAASCIDYIAKFQSNGTKQWLTTVEDSQRPVAVKKVGNGYSLMTSYGMVYDFSSTGAKGENRVNRVNDMISSAYFNDDGSTIALVGRSLPGSSKTLVAHSAAGAVLKTERLENGFFYNLFPTDNGYVAQKQIFGSDPASSSSEIVDIAKDLSTITKRSLNVPAGKGAALLSADRAGNIIVGLYALGSEGQDNIIASFDKSGNKLGQYDFGSANMEGFKSFKDFTLGFVDGEAVFSETARLVKMISFNSDLSVKYEYVGGGDEFVADVARLKDDSLAGVGLALKGSSKIPVTGEANGGYLRLTGAAAPSQPVQKPSTKPNVKNPNTFDGIDVVAIICGLGLLGFGIFLRKNLARR